jgi:ketosteroid isomerase-like protein
MPTRSTGSDEATTCSTRRASSITSSLDDVEWRNAPELPGATPHRGREAVGADLAAQDEAWEWRRAEPVELIPAGDKVVVTVSMSARGKASGAPVVFEIVHVWTFESGKLRRIKAFLDRDAAMRAAGLTDIDRD